MQPKQNIWNVVLFTVLSFLVLLGWGRLQNWFGQPGKQQELGKLPGEAGELGRGVSPSWRELAKLFKEDPELWGELFMNSGGNAALADVPGLGSAARLSANATMAVSNKEHRLASRRSWTLHQWSDLLIRTPGSAALSGGP